LSYGMNLEAAQLASVFITNTIFTMAHNVNLDSPPGADLWLKSAAFGLTYNQGGYTAAVAAHMFNNIREHYLPSLNLFSRTSEKDDRDAFFKMLKPRGTQVEAIK
jgi:hypothetical protein